MTNQHPITPPPELYERWYNESPCDDELGLLEYVATQAAQWGSDQELDACCTEVSWNGNKALAAELRTRRRPKPPSLKERALQAWAAVMAGTDDQAAMADIRRAIEALPND